MARAFLSYSRKDEALVVPLERDLEESGLQVWIDKELTGGQPWWDRILQSIRECDCFLFALSTSSLASEACKRESNYAAVLGKPVLPVLIADGVSTNLLPSALSTIQFIDYRAQDKKAFIALSRAIIGLPPARALPDPLPKPPDVPLSYLSNLGARVGGASALSFEQQSALLLELKRGLRTGEDLADVRQLLRELRGRNDLLAAVAQEIDELLTPPETPKRGSPTGARRENEAETVRRSARTAQSATPDPSDRCALTPGMLVELQEAPQRISDLVAQLQASADCWEVRADADTFVVLAAKNGRCEARVNYGAYFDTKARKLVGMGWRQVSAKSFGDGIAMVLIYVTLGCLLLHERFRKQLKRKQLVRDWPGPSQPGEHFEIAQSVLATLHTLAPAVQRYSFDERNGRADEASWGTFLAGR